MNYGVFIESVGDSSALKFDVAPTQKFGDNDVEIDVVYSGVNFIDIYHRTGVYPLPLPAILGREASGTVSRVGSSVTSLKPGDKVCSIFAPSYAQKIISPASSVVKMPEGISFKIAAGCFTQGLTAHALVTSVYKVNPSSRVLVHAAAGGTGGLIVQMCKLLGATVIGTAGSLLKCNLAKQYGADHVINYSEVKDIAEEVRRLTDGKGVNVAYDGVGLSTWESSLNSVSPRGTLVLFGNASGVVPPFDPLTLTQKGSLYVTRPTVMHYIAEREEFEARCDELFKWITDGKLKIPIAAEFNLEKAKEAHDYLESRSAIGKILLVVDESRKNE